MPDEARERVAPVGAAAEQDEREQVIALVAEVARSLAAGDAVRVALQTCMEAMVRHLDAAFARIWTFNRADAMLELQASAGLYTHLDGSHGRVPLGSFKIGLIAQERLPHLTNEVIGDPRVSEQEWARREGMVAFAGYPLLVEDRLVGVVAMFARRKLSDTILYALSSVADSIALGIERMRSQEELRVSLGHERAARQVAEIERERAADLAEELARVQTQKDEFLSAAAHDLKNPLAGIQGLSQLLARRMDRGGELDLPAMRTGIEQIIDASRRMALLINEMLDTTRLQSGDPLDLNCRSTDLVALVERRAAEHGTITEEYRVTVSHDGSELIGEWDADRLDRVLSNLIANAIKYSPQGGEIKVLVGAEHEPEAAWATVSVADEGIGIPAEDLPHVFDRFFRATNVPADISGTGIGLAAVRQIVEQHGGTVSAESEVGQGSTFAVRLPLGPLSTE